MGSPPFWGSVTRPPRKQGGLTPSTGVEPTPSEVSKLYSRALEAAYAAGSPSLPVYAGADGLVMEVKVKNGQTVKKGDVLVRLDNEDSRIDLDAAKIRFDECSRKLKRLQDLEKALVPPGQELAEGREKAESSMRLAELEVRRCQLRLDRTQIKSPVDGVVVGRGAPENDVAMLANQQVKVGELLMHIQPAEQTGSTDTTAPRLRVGTPKIHSTRPVGRRNLPLNALRNSPLPLVYGQPVLRPGEDDQRVGGLEG